MGCCQLWVVVEAVGVDEVNQEEGKQEPICEARRRVPGLPISRVVAVGLIQEVKEGSGVKVPEEGPGAFRVGGGAGRAGRAAAGQGPWTQSQRGLALPKRPTGLLVAREGKTWGPTDTVHLKGLCDLRCLQVQRALPFLHLIEQAQAV